MNFPNAGLTVLALALTSAWLFLVESGEVIRQGPVSQGGDGEGVGFREVALQLHNYYRAQYQASPLQLDTKLNIIAHHHAEDLAYSREFKPSKTGLKENLWGHLGPLRSLSDSTRDAVNCWYTGSTFPGNTIATIKASILYSNEIRLIGIGVGAVDNYTVVVANYL